MLCLIGFVVSFERQVLDVDKVQAASELQAVRMAVVLPRFWLDARAQGATSRNPRVPRAMLGAGGAGAVGSGVSASV